MKKGVVYLILVFLISSVYSISINELISRYRFSTSSSQVNITNYSDFMIDKNHNGINDTLVFELTTNNISGSFVFVINLFDKSGILANETTKILNSSLNKINLSFSSMLFSQNQFYYSIKVYNLTYSLKYRKDNILTQIYPSFEEGFKITGIKD